MNDIGAQYDVATVAMAQQQDKLEGAESVKLIDGAGGAKPSSPPSQPVSVTPKAGSTVETVA